MQLVYTSRADSSLSHDDLDVLAARSASTNAALGITGLLVHQGGHFCGVLEGPRRVVFARMEAIAIDARHAALTILREEPIRRRRFGNWTFASLPGAAEAPEGAEAFIHTLARGLP